MANSIKPAQIVIDTVVLKADLITEKLYKGDTIQWNLTGGAAGNQAIIQSADDTYIFNGLAVAANSTQMIVLNRDFINGFYIPTLSAGGVLIITRGSGRIR